MILPLNSNTTDGYATSLVRVMHLMNWNARINSSSLLPSNKDAETSCKPQPVDLKNDIGPGSRTHQLFALQLMEYTPKTNRFISRDFFPPSTGW